MQEAVIFYYQPSCSACDEVELALQAADIRYRKVLFTASPHPDFGYAWSGESPQLISFDVIGGTPALWVLKPNIVLNGDRAILRWIESST